MGNEGSLLIVPQGAVMLAFARGILPPRPRVHDFFVPASLSSSLSEITIRRQVTLRTRVYSAGLLFHSVTNLPATIGQIRSRCLIDRARRLGQAVCPAIFSAPIS